MAGPSLVYKLTYSHRVAHELAKLAFIIKNCLWIEEAPFVVLVEYKVSFKKKKIRERQKERIHIRRKCILCDAFVFCVVFF